MTESVVQVFSLRAGGDATADEVAIICGKLFPVYGDDAKKAVENVRIVGSFPMYGGDASLPSITSWFRWLFPRVRG